MPPTQTTQQLVDYYANLLPSEYRSLPNAFATIETLATMGLLQQGDNPLTDNFGNIVFDNFGNVVTDGPFIEPILPLALAQAFNIQTAVGQQLNFIAEGIGAQRSGLNLSGQFVTLSDSDFRLLLQAASARNFLKATTPNILNFLKTFFPGILTARDQLGMHMSFSYLAALGTKLWAELFISQGFLPRDLGVSSVLVDLQGRKFFGFRSSVTPGQSNARGFGSAAAPAAGYFLSTNYLLNP